VATPSTTQLAFVAGATGYVGRQVVRELTERGVRTIAHVRPDSPRLAEWRMRFGRMGAEMDATPWEEGAMKDTLTRLAPTQLFALLGTTRARGRSAASRRKPVESYESVDYGLTSMLLRAAVAAESDPRFVYLSSAGVNGRTGNRYLAARWKLEQELRQSGLPYTIARPSFVTGADREESRPLERVSAATVDALLAAAAALGMKQLRNRYGSTNSTVLARALVRLGFDPAATNRVMGAEALRG
jgi:uncharacterized protein YbjT (DUF2867 family)